MRFTINGVITIEPVAPVSLGGEYDIKVGWHPTSPYVGLGYSALGAEPGGFGGTFPSNIKYTYIRVTHTATDDVIHRSAAIYPNEAEWIYPASQNKADNGGTYNPLLKFHVIQVNSLGAESDDPPSLSTTT